MLDRPSRILLVDDEPGVVRMFKLALDKAGFVTESAGDGLAALAQVGATSFDAIVSDINMPECSGLDLLKAVRERDLDVPVILMTGKPTVESSVRAVEYNAFRYLMKPVLPAALIETVEQAVRLHEMARLKREALELQGNGIKELRERAALESRFAKAVEGLWIAYQPIVSAREKRVYAYEALMRSLEPTLANPLALLEATERIGKLDVLGRTVRERAALAPPNDANLFVNLHARDLNDEDLYAPDAPLTKLARRVVLEITERASFDEVPNLRSRIGRLKALGFRIAIDDLGAGYAGLSSFTELEPDVAKLDMSLVRGIDTHTRKQSIVRSMVELCAEMGIVVISEGVETPAERDTLLALGCDLLQGYLFAKPARGFTEPVWTP
jgi:EAL domain-containing protein (putative c-di-GMP-specific phosphodiesterase class I)/CheY-like chemotaxis protein